MAAKKSRSNYRRIWERYYGPIPNDQPYDIHHIDGDYTNNDISNLQLLTLKEHYDIHYAQGDYIACHAISIRLTLPQDAHSQLHKLSGVQRKGIPRPDMQGDKNPMRDPKAVANLKAATTGVRKSDSHVASMKVGAKRRSEVKISCVFCRKVSNDVNFNKWHGEMCISNPNRITVDRVTNFTSDNPSSILVSCVFCKKEVSNPNFKRWHGDNCKRKIDVLC